MSASTNSLLLLGDDLLQEIFSKLPLKSLLRSNCVSKTWRRLISGSDGLLRRNPPLITSCMFHLQADAAKTTTTTTTRSAPMFAWASSPNQPLQISSSSSSSCSSSIVDCCNGLLLCYSSSSYSICDPISKKWTALPPPRKKSVLSLLAHDPFLSPRYVLVLFTECRPRGAEIETFSSESKVWLRRDLRWNADTDDLSTNISYLGGLLHIVSFGGSIVTVDLQTAECGRIQLPQLPTADSRLGRSGGRLHYTRSNRAEKVINVWVLEDSELSKWSLKCGIRVEGSALSGYFPFQFNILGFHPELEVVYFWVPGRIVSYDLRSKRFGDVCELGFGMEKAYVMQMWFFPFLSNLKM